MERARLSQEVSAGARATVSVRFPAAASSYCHGGAIVFDEQSGEVLGCAEEGEWAVEYAWQDAASRLQVVDSTKHSA